LYNGQLKETLEETAAGSIDAVSIFLVVLNIIKDRFYLAIKN